MSDADSDGDFFDELPEAVTDLAPPRRLLVMFAAVLAAFVFIGVAGAALVFFFVLRVRDHADPNHTVRDTYSHRYASCVSAGGSESACATSVLRACEADTWWTPARVGQRDTVCLAVVGEH